MLPTDAIRIGRCATTERLKPKNLKRAVAKVNQQVQKFNHDFDTRHETISAQYAEIQDSLANITKAIEKGIFTDDLLQRAEQLENENVGFCVVELTETITMRRGELYEMFDSKVKE